MNNPEPTMENQTTAKKPKQPLRHFTHLLLEKRRTISLFVIIPLVIALFAFSSGFVALDLIEYFLLDSVVPFKPIKRAGVDELLVYVKIEVLSFTVLGIIAGIGIAYALLKPLRRIMEGARQVAGGDFTASLETERFGELEPVGKDFNLMVSSLNKYMIDSMSGGWIMMDKAGKIVSVNSGLMALMGCDADDFIGKPIGDMLKAAHLEGEMEQLIESALREQKTHSGRIVNTAASEKNKVGLVLSTAILKDADDVFVGVVASIKDLARAREIGERIQRTGKLAALGGMAANLAHEIRNPLGTIKGLTQLLDEGFGENDRQRKYTRTIVQEVDRLNRVVSDLLNFAQPAILNFHNCGVKELLEHSLGLSRIDIEKKNLRVTRNLPEGLPPVWGDDQKLIQAFLNILLNAAYAANEGGEIRIVAEFAAVPSDAGEKGSVTVKIMNTGSPIDPAILNRIFDPFFTTRKEGVGLGLAITHQIVSLHRGVILAGREDDFTVFALKFPVADPTHYETAAQTAA